MKKQLLPFLLALALPFWAKSQYYHYAPNTLNIPCLVEKGDATLGIGWGRGNAFQALELQGVYSPVQHWAVMANYFGARVEDVRSLADQGTDSYFWEAAVGAYEKLPKGSASLFAGFGTGRLFSNFGSGNSAEFGLQRWFLQPGMAYQSHRFQAALALRLTRLAYSRGEVSFSIEQRYLQNIQNVEKNAPFFLPELGIQAGMRFEPVNISLSICSIFPNTDNLAFARVNTSLSLAVDFGVGRKKKS
ncbi:MAG: hypothetical protein ACKVUS_19410 [Saprospiraceae bacterium]